MSPTFGSIAKRISVTELMVLSGRSQNSLFKIELGTW